MATCLLALLVCPAGVRAARFVDFIGSITDAEGELSYASGVATSSDGLHLYVTADGTDLVAHYVRNPVDASLAFTAAYRDGEGGVSALDGPTAVAISPDDLHVYVAGWLRTPTTYERHLVTFGRNPVDGALTWMGSTPMPGGFGLYPRSMAFSPDGAHLYVAIGSHSTHALHVYARDPGTGALSFVEVSDEEPANKAINYYISNANGVAVSPDGAHVYLASFYCSYGSCLAGFARDPVTGRLTLVDSQTNGIAGVLGIDGITGVALSPDGAHVYASAGGDDSVAVFTRNPATGVLLLIEVERNGVLGVTGLNEATGVAVAPDGGHVYATGRFGGLVAFARDAGTGRLALVEAELNSATVPLFNARRVAVPADGGGVYVVTDDYRGGVSAFSRDAGTGAVTFVEREARFLNGLAQGLDGARDVLVSPGGQHVYVASNLGDAVARFGRDPGTGALTYQAVVQHGVGGVTQLRFPTALAMDPGGAHVYVANQLALTVLARDGTTGDLSFVQTVLHGEGSVDGIGGVQLGSPIDVAVSPDGAHVYVIGGYDYVLATFRRDAATGHVTYLGSLGPPDVGLGYFGYPDAVAVTPDGAHVYVVTDTGLVAYARDSATGSLTLVEVEHDGPGGNLPEGSLSSSLALAVSPDGTNVYVSSGYYYYATGYVLAFRRDPVTGRLGLVNYLRGGPDGDPRLDGLAGIAVRPDGGLVFATGQSGEYPDYPGRLIVLGRAPETGALTVIEMDEDDGGSDATGIDPSSGIAMSPDSRHVYVTSSTSDTVTAFAMSPCSPAVKTSLTVLGVDSPGNDTMVVRGDAILTEPFADLDPVANGLRLVVEGVAGDVRVDVSLPGGAFGGPGTAGWVLAGGKRWLFSDRTGAPTNGFQTAKVVDKSRPGSNAVKVILKGKNGTYPVASTDLPPAATVILGPAACTTAIFAPEGCRPNAVGTAVRCRQ